MITERLLFICFKLFKIYSNLKIISLALLLFKLLVLNLTFNYFEKFKTGAKLKYIYCTNIKIIKSLIDTPIKHGWLLNIFLRFWSYIS